jgi:Concanavalin A-like lectin/glucanases superfamily
MLFLTDDDGIPSIARWVHLAAAPLAAHPTSAYSQMVLGTAGLVSYWPLAEQTGTVAFDIAGAQHGSYYNHPHLAVPDPGTPAAVALNGIDQYVLLPRDVRNDFSLELWFTTAGGGVGTGVTQWWEGAGLLDGEVPGVVDDFGISLDATGQVWAGTGNPDTSIHTEPGLDDGDWHHVVFTRSQATGRLTLFVDGAVVATGAGGTQALTAPPALRLGCLQSGQNFYRGAIAHAATYARALPESEVQAHFHAPR